ncbi:hypothetical protein BG015_002251 [Linnemannia schmuckeri]|uniref:Uncharacterized protein n=1 Tax=Linnemannia schmuckeri TaxID=64567 RepID=A0A9P5S3W6_9FUNG|nr:hypothetical protein BG015_002251 [Linnemannia schmuckeri]
MDDQLPGSDNTSKLSNLKNNDQQTPTSQIYTTTPADGFSETMAKAGGGNKHAQVALVDMYRDGQGVSVSRDDTKAMDWCLTAAAQGCTIAQNNIGSMFDVGQGVLQDYTKALLWYFRAAEQGYAAAPCNMGSMYSNDRGMAQDEAKGME